MESFYGLFEMFCIMVVLLIVAFLIWISLKEI